MNSIKRWRPSPSLVVSFVALFVALSGTALALKANSVGSKHIKENAVRSKHIKDGHVKAAELGTVIDVTQPISVPAGGHTGTVATCPPGTRVISGGGRGQSSFVVLTDSNRSGNGWHATAKNNFGSSQQLTAYATCLQE
jgi:hypothetical protein